MDGLGDRSELSAELRSLLSALAHAPAWPIADELRIAPGDRIGRYVLEEIIGRGGFGVVFAAHDEELRRRVAIKVTRGEATPGVLERFQREARIAARLNHPNLVTLHDSGTIEGLPYLVLELLDGETLADRLHRGSLPIDDALSITADVLRAIAKVHEAGIVHLDLKPSNVFVTKDARIKVLDFGLAELRTLPSDGPRAGTPAYMAPEQWRGVRDDARSDLFSIGVMLFAMTAGELPFGGARPTSSETDEPAPALERGVPRLRAIVARALAKDPEQRFSTAAAMLAAVEDLRRPKRSAVGPWIAGLTIVAAGIALTVSQVRAQRASADAARLAEHAGREAEAIEADLRFARLQPLHDIRADEKRAHDRLDALRSEVEAAGSTGGNSTSIALARAERALHELEQARERLETIVARGDRTPAALTALGEVMLDEFEQRSRDARRSDDPEVRAAALAKLTSDYGDPALRYLREAAAATPFLLARMALYERRFDDARKLASDAVAASPGLYEAIALKGDTYAVESDDAWARGDFPAVFDRAKHAGDAYAEAATIARSDPELYTADCRRLRPVYKSSLRLGHDPAASFTELLAACGRGLAARPNDPETVTEEIEARLARTNMASARSGGPVLAEVSEMLAILGAARAEHPDDGRLAMAAGVTFIARANYESTHDLDPRPTWDLANDAFLDAIRTLPQNPPNRQLGVLAAQRAEYQLAHGIDPDASVTTALERLKNITSPETLNASGRALAARAAWQLKHGADPRPALDQAIAIFERVRALRPTDNVAPDEEGGAWETRGLWEVANGIDASESLDKSIACTEALLAMDADDETANGNLGEELLIRANAEHRRGGDAWPFYRRAIEASEKSKKLDSAAEGPFANLASAYAEEVNLLVLDGKDPSAPLRSGRESLAAARAIDADPIVLGAVGCDLEHYAGNWEAHEHRSPLALYARARASCEIGLARDDKDADLNLKLAGLLVDVIAWKRGHGLDAAADVATGVTRGKIALDANPRSKEANDVDAALAKAATTP